MILVVDRRHVKSMDNEKMKIPFTDIYIGGAPPEILQSRYAFLVVRWLSFLMMYGAEYSTARRGLVKV